MKLPLLLPLLAITAARDLTRERREVALLLFTLYAFPPSFCCRQLPSLATWLMQSPLHSEVSSTWSDSPGPPGRRSPRRSQATATERPLTGRPPLTTHLHLLTTPQLQLTTRLHPHLPTMLQWLSTMHLSPKSTFSLPQISAMAPALIALLTATVPPQLRLTALLPLTLTALQPHPQCTHPPPTTLHPLTW